MLNKRYNGDPSDGTDLVRAVTRNSLEEGKNVTALEQMESIFSYLHVCKFHMC